ncbi:hypothetical protein HAV15_010635 [Penicillium sp. str. |nr:hypothetical protein HAV15_010635 [Penicillium sp. str. \
MDSPDHRPDATVWPFQDILCPSAEHEDLFPMHPADQVVEQWLSPELILRPSTQSRTLNEPFQLLLEQLKRLDQDAPDIAQSAAHISSLYSTLWESYSAKKAHVRRLENENEALRATNTHLCEKQVFLEYQNTDQEALLVYFEHAFENVRHGILSILKDWERRSPVPVIEHYSVPNIRDPPLA